MLGGHHVVNGWRCESRLLTRNQQQYNLHHFWVLCDDFPDHALLELVRGSGHRKLQLRKRKAKSQQSAARDRKEMDRCANHDLSSKAYFKDQHYRPAVRWLYDPTLLKSKVWQVHHDHDENQDKAVEVAVAKQDICKNSDFVFGAKNEQRSALDINVSNRSHYHCLLFIHVVV